MITQTSTKIIWEETVKWLRQQPEQEALVKACIYDDNLIGAAERFFHRPEWQELKKYLLSKSGKVCDVRARINLTHILNPYESDINLYPRSKNQLEQSLSGKIHFQLPKTISDFILACLGSYIPTPGRLYSFIGRKQYEH